jgi:hypothetical protein
VLSAIGLAGCAAAACTVALAFTNDRLTQPGLNAAFAVWVMLPYILTGLIAW